MSKRSRPSKKVVESLETKKLRKVEAVLYYCLNVTSRIKDYTFQVNRLLQNEVKRRKIQAKKAKNAKCMALQRQMESSQQRQTRLQVIKQFAHSWRHLKKGY